MFVCMCASEGGDELPCKLNRTTAFRSHHFGHTRSIKVIGKILKIVFNSIVFVILLKCEV